MERIAILALYNEDGPKIVNELMKYGANNNLGITGKYGKGKWFYIQADGYIKTTWGGSIFFQSIHIKYISLEEYLQRVHKKEIIYLINN